MDNGYYERVAIPGLAGGVLHRASLFHDRGRRQARIFFSIRERDIRRGNLRRFPYHFLFRRHGHEVRILVVRHHHRYQSFEFRRRKSMAEFEECRLEWTWIFIGTSGGGGRDSESVQAS